MENSIYVFAAYAMIWLFTLGYIFSIGQRQNALRKEIEALKIGLSEEGPAEACNLSGKPA